MRNGEYPPPLNYVYCQVDGCLEETVDGYICAKHLEEIRPWLEKAAALAAKNELKTMRKLNEDK